MVYLYVTLTMNGAYRTGSGSGWVSKWVVNECDTLDISVYCYVGFINSAPLSYTTFMEKMFCFFNNKLTLAYCNFFTTQTNFILLILFIFFFL
jgi:hypothetical protein